MKTRLSQDTAPFFNFFRCIFTLFSAWSAWQCLLLYSPLRYMPFSLIPWLLLILIVAAWKPFLAQVRISRQSILLTAFMVIFLGYKLVNGLLFDQANLSVWITQSAGWLLSIYSFLLLFSSLQKLVSSDNGVIRNWIQIQMNSSLSVSKKTILIVLAGAAVTLTICSVSSFLYPVNPYPDPNFFFTLGKSWVHGLIPYRDVYEQKGPILYLIHAAAYLISNKTFFGVYLIEILFVGCFLVLAVKTVNLFIPADKTINAFLLLISLIFTAYCFRYGDNAEEFCLPMLMVPLYLHGKALQCKSSMRIRDGILIGIAAGMVFWIKYTMVGLFIGWFLFISVQLFSKKSWKVWWQYVWTIAIGVLAVSLPVVMYFYLSNGLYDLFMAYFYNNIFLYPKDSNENKLISLAVNILSNLYQTCVENPVMLICTVASLYTLRRMNRTVYIEWLLSFAFLILFTFAGGRCYPYYAGSFVIFSIMAVIPMSTFIQAIEWKGKRAKPAVLCLLSFLVMAGIDFTASRNVKVMKINRDLVPELMFSRVIEQVDHPDLISYGILDRGYLTPSGALPTIKYYCLWNVPIEEKWSEPNRAIAEKRPKFIVSETSDGWSGYQMIAVGNQDEVPMEYAGPIYLYAREDLIPDLDLSVVPQEARLDSAN